MKRAYYKNQHGSKSKKLSLSISQVERMLLEEKRLARAWSGFGNSSIWDEMKLAVGRKIQRQTQLNPKSEQSLS